MRSLDLGILATDPHLGALGSGGTRGTLQTLGVLPKAPEAGEKASQSQGVMPNSFPLHVEGDDALDLPSAASIARAARDLDVTPRIIPLPPNPTDSDLARVAELYEVDACVLALHGSSGGSGRVQAHLARRGIPFAGPGAHVVATAFDKVSARRVLAQHNIPVPTAVALAPDRPADARALGLLGWPCVIKPRRGAGSRGVTYLHDPSEVDAAVAAARAVDHEMVLERAMSGPEVQVVLLGEQVIGSMEVAARPQDPQQVMVCPPQVGATRLAGIHALARRATAALDLHGCLVRVDILLTPRHNEIVLEVEPLPPLHADGVVARVARAAGLDMSDLLGRLLDRILLGVPQIEPPRLPHAAALMLQ